MIGDHALVAPLISEVDVEKVKHGGVDELSLLEPGVVLHLRIIQHLPVLPPSRGHRRIAAAGRHAAQGHVVPAQRHRRLWVSCDVGFGEIVCGGGAGTESDATQHLNKVCRQRTDNSDISQTVPDVLFYETCEQNLQSEITFHFWDVFKITRQHSEFYFPVYSDKHLPLCSLKSTFIGTDYRQHEKKREWD